MKHLTLGIHFPKDGNQKNILDAAEKVTLVARTCDGLIDAGVSLDEKNERIIMFSLWENTEVAIQASKILRPIIAEIPFSDWERQPSDNMVELKRIV